MSESSTIESMQNCYTGKTREQKRLNICFVVAESPQFLQSLNFSLLKSAKKQSQNDHEVTILLTHPEASYDSSILKACDLNSQNLIQFLPLKYAGPVVSSLSLAVQSYQVMEWLLAYEKEFDEVHFPLAQGIGYYTLLAQHQGWAFQKSILCVEIDSPTLWKKHTNHKEIDKIDDLTADFLEQYSLRWANQLFISNYEVWDWIKKEEWVFDQKSFMENGERIRKAACDFAISDKKELPLVSVCVTHFNRPHYLAQLMESIRNQNYAPFEVILVDDASTHPEAKAYLEDLSAEFASKGWKIICNQQNLFPGAARNIAASHSQGEYLLFMDDDNYAKSDQIKTFVEVAQFTKADILTCAMDVFDTSSQPNNQTVPIHRFVPLGDAVALGLYLNVFGDINALIKKTAYLSLNGMTEDRGVGGEDWEFFARAVLKGYCLTTIPKALFWYRDTPRSISKITSVHQNYLRGIRAYINAVPLVMKNNLILAQTQQEQLNRMVQENQSLKKILSRFWKLFFQRIYRALSHPSKIVKKIMSNS